MVTVANGPNPTIESLRGAAGSLPKPTSWDELRTIAREDHWPNTGLSARNEHPVR